MENKKPIKSDVVGLIVLMVIEAIFTTVVVFGCIKQQLNFMIIGAVFFGATAMLIAGVILQILCKLGITKGC